MSGSSLLGWITLGGLLVLLVSEAVLSIIPYVRLAAEGGLLEAARKTGLARGRPEEDPARIEGDREGPLDSR